MFSGGDRARGSWLKSSVALIFLFVFISPIGAAPVLPHLFSDHMVLQRDSEVHIWGWADPGEKVSVDLAGKTKESIADGDGHWKVVLPRTLSRCATRGR